ncbi:MAG: hypothetical protein M1533_05600 [Candidatus Thermoplasmatota archaeon]|jgi:diaminopimelate decarboxylase|nr:hypothetical protein [Candidatus Thermoplasmatota archaeon]MCL5794502.1 hypothetical protein [Candidatus Thermoplasmatota archaeon]
MNIPYGYSNEDGSLCTEEVSIAEAAREYGTPCYVYSQKPFRSRSKSLMESLKNIRAGGVEVFYSMKANPSPIILQWAREAGLHSEVSSLGELEMALSHGFKPHDIILLGPGKSRDLIEAAMAHRILALVVESHREANIAAELDNGVTRVLVRINVEQGIPGLDESMIGGVEKFGINVSELGKILGELVDMGKERLGVHYYLGSQILDHETMLKYHTVLLNAISSYSEMVGTIDCGGGFGVPYSENDPELDLHAFVDGFSKLLSMNGLSGKEIWFETGRYVAADCGVFVTRVMDVKRGAGGSRTIITDGGMNDFFRMAFMKADHPIRLINRLSDDPVNKDAICGPLCTPLDSFGRAVRLPAAVKEGDLIGIFKAGAYGLTMSPILFLLHSIPKEIAIREGRAFPVSGNDHTPFEIYSRLLSS